MSATITESYGKISESDIAAFERRHGVTLPPHYQGFLLRTNGGRPDRTGLDIPGWPGRGTAIHFFFGIHEGKHNNLDSWTDRHGDDLPEGFIPIGIDMGGCLLCLGTTDKHEDEVWYWDNSGDYGLSEETGNLFLVSKDIDQLLGQLGSSNHGPVAESPSDATEMPSVKSVSIDEECPIRRGDSLRVVKDKLGVQFDPTAYVPIAGEESNGFVFEFPDRGMLVFFNDDRVVRTIVVQEGFRGAIDGVRIADTATELESAKGPPDYFLQWEHGDSWVYEEGGFARFDIDESDRVRRIIV